MFLQNKTTLAGISKRTNAVSANVLTNIVQYTKREETIFEDNKKKEQHNRPQHI